MLSAVFRAVSCLDGSCVVVVCRILCKLRMSLCTCVAVQAPDATHGSVCTHVLWCSSTACMHVEVLTVGG
jgi:hypothetical protein